MKKERTVQLGVNIVIHCALGCLVQTESESGVSKQSGVWVLSLATVIFHSRREKNKRNVQLGVIAIQCTLGCLSRGRIIRELI